MPVSCQSYVHFQGCQVRSLICSTEQLSQALHVDDTLISRFLKKNISAKRSYHHPTDEPLAGFDCQYSRKEVLPLELVTCKVGVVGQHLRNLPLLSSFCLCFTLMQVDC